MSKGMLWKIVEEHPKTASNAIRFPTNSSTYPERKVRMKKMTKKITRKMKIYKLINAQYVYVVSFRFINSGKLPKLNFWLHVQNKCYDKKNCEIHVSDYVLPGAFLISNYFKKECMYCTLFKKPKYIPLIKSASERVIFPIF